jgi:hypothetical protein
MGTPPGDELGELVRSNERIHQRHVRRHTLVHRPWMSRCVDTTTASAVDTGITRPL